MKQCWSVSSVTSVVADLISAFASPISGETRLAAVIGDPVRHSLSPQIHNAAYQANGLDWRFLALPVAAGRAPAALDAMRALSIEGFSVTMPHKEVVAGHVDELMPAAAALASVNCVRREGDRLIGDSTDGIGFVRALESDIGRSIADASVAIVGAGGAARSIIDAVARAGASRIVVVNRTQGAAERAAALSPIASVGAAAQVVDVDIIVNTTSVGMASGPAPDTSAVAPEFLRGEHIVADIVYQPRRTPLLQVAADIGAHTVGGLGMLVHQAAVAFEWWTGQPAPLDAMTAAVATA